ncbi:hypothetical protein [Caenimonas koreensis]|uniref:hypothetical protein n=1 Tax=Caenimonas koreensis TaxID=367474 RepID=UPI001890315B|nr:hypothetical protein [Caenimonas koreensis]
MDWVTHAVAAFGQSIGIADLALDSDGYALFTLEDNSLLCLHDLVTAGGDEVLITLSRPLPAPQAAAARRALLAADFRKCPLGQIQLATRGADLAVTLRMPRHSVMLSALEDGIDALFRFHANVTQMH